MARIALRAYNREIEHFIEGGQFDEAIAHCRHIFKYFPKHIHTYRLLGKAYLETQRYGDAADILQRVLSSIPDDFISHLGMSIIREDEGNLDEAIWHMERAFEVQPANRAIQDELRRLYGRRDGLEPPKIRLTRGALARMYAKGELYPQAVAELRAALAEDPQRLDLQVVLADVYSRAGQRVEAASICNGLLRKLPYCLVANQVMADILADSERSEDARVYRQRAQALDAYLAHISPGAPTPDKVPDIAVSLERLDWQPGKAIEGPSQPDWAASLGVELEAGGALKEDIPDWLSAVQTDADLASISDGGESSAPFTDLSDSGSAWAIELEADQTDDWSSAQASDAAQLSSEAEIPEWMKSAGWSPSTGAADEEMSGFDFDEEDLSASQPEGELAEANLPDWLKEIAPENLDQISSTAGDEAEWDQPSDEDATILQDTPDWFMETEDEKPEQEESEDWLAGLAGTAGVGAIAGAEMGADDEIPAESAEDLPDWLKDMEVEDGTAPEDQIPEWLQDSGAEAELPTVTALGTPEEASASDELADWLQEVETEEAAAPTSEALSAEGVEAEAEPADEIPDWLKEMDPEAGETVISEPEIESELEPAEALPDWLQEKAGEGEEAVEPETSMEVLDSMDETEAEAGEGTTDQAIPDETISIEETPDWLEKAPVDETELGTAKIEIDEAAIPTEELQAWMIADEGEPAGEPAVEVPDSLIEMQAETGTDAISDELPDTGESLDAEIAPAIQAEAEALPDEGLAVDIPTEEIEAELGEAVPETLEKDEEPVLDEQEAAPVSGLEESAELDAMDADSAFAWLESLAVKQGADEALLLSPEDRVETPPEWVQAAIESETEEVGQADLISEPELDETPEMAAMLAEQELESQAEVSEQAEILPEEAIEELSGLEMEAGEILADQEGLDQPETMPDWLQEAGEVIETGDEAEEELPDWLEEGFESTQLEVEEPAQPAEELPDWLKTMQLEQEQAEATDQEVEEELPDWLQEPAEDAVEQEQTAETQEDWLAGLEEPIIEGDTKPTRLGLEPQEAEAGIPEDSSTLISPISDAVGEELAAVEPEAESIEPEIADEPLTGDETMSDADADFAWLESLAVKQGADEALLLEPEERLEGPPEWIQSALDKQFGADQVQESYEEKIESADEIAPETQPTMIEETIEVSESVEETPDLPDWLSDIEAEVEHDEAEEAIDAIAESAAMIEQEEVPELPSWLEDTDEKEETAWVPAEPALQKLDLNQASLAELERLPGIGFIMAQKIIIYREQNGPFANPLDLQQIPGFSPSMLQEIEDLIIIETVAEEPLDLPVDAGTLPELIEARRVMLGGSLEEALEKYNELVFQKKSLEEVIYDLNQILLRHSDDADVWQTLGDAQMRANHVQDALEAYTRAEQLFQ